MPQEGLIYTHDPFWRLMYLLEIYTLAKEEERETRPRHM